jgi:hypothetical protein
MGFINKLIQIITLLCVLLVVLLGTFVGVFSSNQKLTQALDKSGFYKSAAELMSKSLKDQVVTDSPLLTESIKNSIATTVNADVARTVIQPSQIVFVEWLNSNIKNIDVNLDLLSLKNKISATTSNAQVKFEITKLLPDNYEVINSKKSNDGFISQMEQIRSAYTLAKIYLPYLWLALGVSSLLLFILNIRSGSKKFTRILYPAVIASAIGLALAFASSYGSDLVIGNFASSSQTNGAALLAKLLLTILQETLNIFITIFALGIIGIIISKAVYRGRDKDLKKKRRHRR